MKLWLGEGLCDEAAARIAPGDRGLLLGDGLYETLAVRGGRPVRPAAHLARLARGAAVLDLPLPALDLAAVLQATVKANGLETGSLRLTLTRGSGPRGIAPPERPAPTLLVTAFAAAPGAPAPAAPVAAVIARTTRRNEQSPLATIKSLNALDGVLARQEAARRGAGEAILLNTAGRVAEAAAANLFVLAGGRLLTPPAAEGALPGVMRGALLAAGAEEAPLTPEALLAAEAAVVTSALAIRPLGSLEGRDFPGDSAGLAASLAADLLPARG